jgi:hypothetical protein
VRLPDAVGLAAVALVLGALAVVERQQPVAAAALAVGAVAFGSLALVPIFQERPVARETSPARPPTPETGVRDWLRSGPIGREEIVLLLDRLDRSSGRPDLPSSATRELARVRGLPPSEFRRYVAHRLDEIEAGR